MAHAASTLRPRAGLAGRPWIRPTAIAGVVALLVLVVLQQTGLLNQAVQSIPGLGATTPTYQSGTVARGNVAVSVVATGPVTAVSSLPLSFKSSGKLADLKVTVGDSVKQGQVLAALDTTDLRVALAQARASLASAQATLTKLETGPTDAAKRVSQASVDNARTSATDAQKAIANAQESAAKDVAAAQASVASAETSLSTAQATLGSTQDQLAKSLAADEVTIANARKNLEAVKASTAANQAVRLQNLEKAKDDLWATQISRDATCGRSQGPDCRAANANVAGAETSVNTAQANIELGLKQDQASVQQAQASLDTAQAALASDQTKLNASVVSAQNSVRQAQAALESARASAAQTQVKAATSVQSAQSSANQAAGSAKSAEATYAQTVADPTQYDLDSAKAQVASAQAAVMQAEANLAAATLTAPFDATVAAVNGVVGQYISGGPTSANSTTTTTDGLITLVSLDNLRVTASVNEADIGKVKVGNPVAFTVSAYPSKSFTGKVLSVLPIGTSAQNVVSYSVISSIQSLPGAALYPTMTATATITTDQRTNAVLVPNSALSFALTAQRTGLVAADATSAQTTTTQPGASTGQARQAQSGATTGQRQSAQASTAQATDTSAGTKANVVVMRDGKLALVAVTTGITDGASTELLSGLQEGDTVVTSRSTSGAVSASTSTSTQRQSTTTTSNPLSTNVGGPGAPPK